MNLKLRWICDIIGHIWIQIRHQRIGSPFGQNGKSCKRCGKVIWHEKETKKYSPQRIINENI